MSLVQSTPRAAIAHVHHRLGKLAAEWFGDGWRVATPVPEPIRRAWSFQFPFIVEGEFGSRRLIAKIPIWEDAPTLEAALTAGPQSSTRAEFDTLQRLAAAVADAEDPAFAAVEAIAYVADLNAIVTAELESRNLRDHLGAPFGRETAALLAHTGRLLRLYHEIGGLVRGPFPAEDARRRIDRLRDASSVGAMPARLCEGIEAIEHMAADAVHTEVCVAVIHNDLNPANVLVTPEGRVAVLDPSPGPGAAGDDIAKLLVAVRTLPRRLMSGGIIPGRSAVTSWTRALLAGYLPTDRDAVALFRAMAVARRWVDLEPRLTRLGPLRRMARSVLGAELEDALAGRW
jgi:aminoglycoside phosphotransferase (APT) family kinase protein